MFVCGNITWAPRTKLKVQHNYTQWQCSFRWEAWPIGKDVHSPPHHHLIHIINTWDELRDWPSASNLNCHAKGACITETAGLDSSMAPWKFRSLYNFWSSKKAWSQVCILIEKRVDIIAQTDGGKWHPKKAVECVHTHNFAMRCPILKHIQLLHGGGNPRHAEGINY